MKTNIRRFALLTGVSVAALGVSNVMATVAHAAPQGLGDGVYPGGVTLDPTIEICDLATGPGQDGDPPCFYGEIETGGTAEFAVLNSFLNGRVTQLPTPPTTATIEVDGVADFYAYATAQNTNGTALADAFVSDAVNQYKSGAGDADFLIDNDGTLTIAALAQAVVAGSGDALAYATLVGGVFQGADMSGEVDLTINNDVAMTIGADAYASAPDGAYATAVNIDAIAQVGYGSNVAIDFNNNGPLDIHANAIARGGTVAVAEAYVGDAIRQYASGTDGVAIDFDNGAGDTIGVIAYASGTAKSGDGYAEADVERAFHQEARGSTAEASVGLTNAGSITIAAIANAAGETEADAVAMVTDAFVQIATGNVATVDLTNSAGGSVFVGAEASAAAKSGEANATATVNTAIHQLASGTTSADVGLSNDGSIVISAVARASGTEFVDAEADINRAIWQQAYATDGAYASIVNNGSIGINVRAEAYGTAGGTGTGDAAASAEAFADDLIQQYASAGDFLVGGGDAVVRLVNGADAAIDANVTAIADGRGEDGDRAAFAYASVDGFIAQTANSFKSGTAAASLLNEGTISLDVNAVAMGIDADATPDALYGDASAFAYINGGIEQQAAGKSGATAYMTNGAAGVISINAAAVATGGPVFASAVVNTAINQQAGAKSGDAFATIINDGAIDIGALAQVTGDAQAVAIINGAINQSAFAGYETAVGYETVLPDGVDAALVVTTGNDANVTLINNGTIDIHATALAHDTIPGGFATATAQVNGAIGQNAVATSGGAGVEISGAGSIDILAIAYATADAADEFGFDGSAFAYATINDAIDQTAESFVYGSASAFLSQGGGIDIIADANAAGVNFAYASANINGGGIDQNVDANAYDTAFAIASIVNPTGATINIIAAANAVATDFFIPYESGAPVFGTAIATANVETGIAQEVDAFAAYGTADTTPAGTLIDYTGTATAIAAIDNDGIINVGAVAEAAAYYATAVAGVGVGISQDAAVIGGELAQAYATILNAGEINVFASAIADGIGYAGAYASVGLGIDQHADAFAVEGTAVAVASITNTGDILVVANADAVALGEDVLGGELGGVAYASAFVGTGIHQYAYASGFGIAAVIDDTPVDIFVIEANEASFSYAGLGNTGSIVIAANAEAEGEDALAFAGVANGVLQEAIAYASFTATAAVSITNALGATIAVMADAAALGDYATAIAGVGTGVEQFARAAAKSGTATADAVLTNDGLISINADAVATGYGSAVAAAGIEAGVYQVAYASGTVANAGANMVNNGTIAVTADATANAYGTAAAQAGIGIGVLNAAVAYGSTGVAAATMINNGTILVGADASAVGDVAAYASAGIEFGVVQVALAPDVAAATIANGADGLIAVIAEADAGGDEPDFAGAVAAIGVGVQQVAVAYATDGAAVANIENLGEILIMADADGANASEGSAFAGAFIGSGINQFATAYGTAVAGIDNVGSIDVIALASATADDDAGAIASIGTVLYQQAIATGAGGYASATLTNTGSIVGAADATVLGGDTVEAIAIIDQGIVQLAIGSHANATVANEGYITMVANAAGVGGGDGLAVASAQGGSQIAYGTTSANAVLVNDGSLIVSADADVLVGNAALKGASALAVADAVGWVQDANAADTFTATAFVTFTDAFPDTAVASDYLTGVGFQLGFSQTLTPGGFASASIVNSGVMVVQANASAVGDDDVSAVAAAQGADQSASAGTAEVSFVNDGYVTVLANAYASGDNGALAVAAAGGIEQDASAVGVAKSGLITGEGTLHLDVDGTELVTELAYFTASAYQTVSLTFTPTGNANALVVNTGSLVVAADAQANNTLGAGDGVTAPALAIAGAFGVDQNVNGAYASATVDNSGSITVLADAVANGATAALAYASAVGIAQNANAVAAEIEIFSHYETVTATTPFGHTDTYLTFVTTGLAITETPVGPASVLVDNSGSLVVAAEAVAVAGSTAYATALAAGVLQGAAGTVASASVLNTGEIDVIADASASGTSAFAFAGAIGVGQSLSGTTMNATFTNEGDFSVIALAAATGTTGSATAQAVGLSAAGNGGGSLSANVYNGTNEFFVGASAVAPGGAYATAQGIVLSNAPTTTVVGTETVVLGNPITGYITNDGTMEVLAMAAGGTFTTVTTGGDTITVARSSAYATAISIASGVNTMTINNNGTIDVTAVTENGGSATARGIYVTANGDTVPLVGEVLTINNDGDILVRQSSDGGDTFFRGMAIDVATAPNNTVINLLSGNIYGNIDVQTGDAINVIEGETDFNGIINPECMPAGGPTALTLDNPAQNLCGEGDMFIGDGGTFHMVIDPNEGPSYAFVNTLLIGEDGTLELDLPAADGTAPIGTYPQIFAEDVDILGGTLIANIQTPNNGLFETTVYENVIDGITLDGEFDQCIVTGVPANSLLLDFGCVYDTLENVDLRLTRVPFDQVPGLNDNGTSVGEGLECIYDVALTGGIADLLADLFLFSDPVNYNIALNQLSGSVYANYLQSFSSLGVHYNDILAKATDCEVPALAGSVLECRASAPIHLWGQADYQWRKADGDEEAGTTKSKRGSFVVGLDANVGAAGIIGGSIGYVTNHVRDNQFGDNADADGLQVGLYGVYDPGTFYVKGMTTYSWYNGESSRNINFGGLATGATFAASPDGDPDVTMWTAGIHAGARLAMGGNSVLTPYLNYDYVNAKLKGFTESGGNGADLTVYGGRAKHSYLTGGVKWATQLGGVVPEVNLGYRYRFGDKRSDFNASFLGDAGCDFDIISAAQKKGTILAGVSVGGKMGPVDLRIGYEGEFNSDVTSHAANFKFVLPLGGRAAPPPPPPVIAPPPPPPPPPPPVEEAPPPPPPPPPPAPERGQ